MERLPEFTMSETGIMKLSEYGKKWFTVLITDVCSRAGITFESWLVMTKSSAHTQIEYLYFELDVGPVEGDRQKLTLTASCHGADPANTDQLMLYVSPSMFHTIWINLRQRNRGQVLQNIGELIALAQKKNVEGW